MEFDIETLRPTYRLHIGQFGMSNALMIARRLKLPKDLLKRARKYVRRRKGKTGELNRLQQLREEAEKARTEALARQHDADRQRDDYEKKLAALERRNVEEQKLNEWRSRIQVGETVWASKFGKSGKVVRVNQAKGTVFVGIGIGQWEVFLAEVLPEEPKPAG